MLSFCYIRTTKKRSSLDREAAERNDYSNKSPDFHLKDGVDFLSVAYNVIINTTVDRPSSSGQDLIMRN